MKIIGILLFCSIIISVNATPFHTPYDYTYTNECKEEPESPLYGGGATINPEFDDGLSGWTAFGNVTIESRVSRSGNCFGVSSGRNGNDTNANAGISQEFFLLKEKLYTFSAWVQISDGEAEVLVLFKVPDGSFTRVAEGTAKVGCWTMLKGGLTVDVSGPGQLFFKAYDASLEIMVDSVSLQPFTQEEWEWHQENSIEMVRKSMVKLALVDDDGRPLTNKTISVSQRTAKFPLGCAMSKFILNNTAYRDWFISKQFKYSVFVNEMKWYENELTQNHEDYTSADAMLEFTRKHGISVRGHTVFWDNKEANVEWVKSLSPSELQVAARKRIFSIMNRYRGKVIAWDVINENVHYDFLESRLGATASADFLKIAHMLDTKAPLFLNEYNTIENPRDDAVYPAKYLAKIAQIRAEGYNGPLSIGLQGHFWNGTINIPYMRSAMDIMASAGLPIWITELDAQPGPYQVTILEKTIKESYAHPAVQGIMIWSLWQPSGCYEMCLADADFNNLPTGDVVDKVLAEWEHSKLSATTNENGVIELLLTYGDYDLQLDGIPGSVRLKVVPTPPSGKQIQKMKISAASNLV